MRKSTFTAALKSSDLTVASRLIELIECEAAMLDSVDGKAQLVIAQLCGLGNIACGIAAWDNYENCNALITHDLNSFKCWDLGALITKIRLGER